MHHSKQLEEQPVGKLLFKFSIPSIIGMLITALYNIIDRIFVGHGVNSDALSAVGIALPIIMITCGFGLLFGVGTGAWISIKLGKKDKDGAEKVLGNGLFLIVISSIIITIIGLLFNTPILTAFGADSKTLAYAQQFSIIILLGTIVQNIGMGLNSAIRAEGNPKIAMLTLIIGAVLNTILNPFFIFVLHLGIVGSALSTVISQTVTTIWVLTYFVKRNSLLKLKIVNFKLEKHVVLGIMSIGISPFVMQIASSLVMLVLNQQLKLYGGDRLYIGAMTIINSFTMLLIMPLLGVGQGAQPIIGYNYGAGLYTRVKKTLKLEIIAAFVVSSIGFLIIELFPQIIVQLFTKDEKLIAITKHGIQLASALLFIVGFQIVSSNYFQSIRKAKISAFLALSRQVIFLIPALFILPKFFGLDGIWISMPVADFLSASITAIFLIFEVKNLREKGLKQNSIQEVFIGENFDEENFNEKGCIEQ